MGMSIRTKNQGRIFISNANGYRIVHGQLEALHYSNIPEHPEESVVAVVLNNEWVNFVLCGYPDHLCILQQEDQNKDLLRGVSKPDPGPSILCPEEKD
jgi:hypothetical protein